MKRSAGTTSTRSLATAGDQVAWRWRMGLLTIIACLALPLVIALVLRRRFSRRPMIGMAAKLSGDGPPLPQGRILIHGVSLGEVHLMRALTPDLDRFGGGACLLTTTTETGWQGLQTSFPDHPRAFFPLDLPWAVDRFIARTRPRAVILLEAEFWPLWLCACLRRDIPVHLLNARVSDRSFRRMAWLRPALTPFFSRYQTTLAQNGQYAARLRKLGGRGSAVCGSLKADMVRLATPSAIVATMQRIGLTGDGPLLLLASTSAGEERTILSDQLSRWLGRGWQVAICPRHPERGGELAALIQQLGGRACRTSLGERRDDPRTVAIIDEIGQLSALYGACAASCGIAVVGGSLGSGRGGQNMLEAAAHRCATVVGWDVKNQPDSMALLRACDGIVETTAETLQTILCALADDDVRRLDLGDAGHAAWHSGQGAAQRTVKILEPAFR